MVICETLRSKPAIEKPAKVQVVRLIIESQALGVVDVRDKFSGEKAIADLLGWQALLHRLDPCVLLVVRSSLPVHPPSRRVVGLNAVVEV